MRADGRKELVALADGYREAVESWANLLRDAARRGMRAPALAIGDGARGFWGALREVSRRPERSDRTTRRTTPTRSRLRDLDLQVLTIAPAPFPTSLTTTVFS